jgi:hypothetical protein
MIATQIISMNENFSFVKAYSLNKGLKKFGERGHEAAFGEMKQLHERGIFAPRDIKSLTQQEKR